MCAYMWTLKEEFDQHLENVYKDINVQSGNTIFYLGLQLDFDKMKRSVQISQPGYVEDLQKKFTVERTAATPAMVNLFDTTKVGTPIDSTSLASKLMKLSFLAKRTRPDLLLAVSFLASRMKNPYHLDDRKLQRVYEYLSGTKEYYFKLQPKNLRIILWTDASYAVPSMDAITPVFWQLLEDIRDLFTSVPAFKK